MNLFQHFTVLLVVSCALTLLTAEARKKVKKFKIRPLIPTRLTGKLTRTDLKHQLQATLADLDFLNISLKALVDAKSFDGKDDVYPGYGTKELNPTDKTKLSSDKKFRLLDQMTWWLTWIEASLRILQEIMLRVKDKKLNPNDIVPVANDTDNGNVFTIDSTLTALLMVKRSVNHLHSMLGHDINTTANNSPFSCINVTVMQACRKKKKPDCTKERDRAYIVLRDAHKAVEKMGEALSGCEGKKKGTEIVLKCTRNVIFYQKKCQKTLCGMQKKRCKCLSWTYE